MIYLPPTHVLRLVSAILAAAAMALACSDEPTPQHQAPSKDGQSSGDDAKSEGGANTTEGASCQGCGAEQECLLNGECHTPCQDRECGEDSVTGTECGSCDGGRLGCNQDSFQCNAVLCEEDERVADGRCVACPATFATGHKIHPVNFEKSP
ncbi:MAG: hypothetical protein MK135_10610 [Polyangiaceae bacterium]|nr:hypothetical protein [Polyangiaceae bacterium]